MLLGITIYIRHVYLKNLLPVSQSNKSVLVTIPTGSTLTDIANILDKAGVIRSSWAFEWYVKNDDNSRANLEAGTYELRPSETVQQIVVILTQGDVAPDQVVILPGQRIDQVEKALIHDGFSQADVISALKADQYRSDFPMLKTLPPGADLEGFLYPDSFAKTTTTKAGDIIKESLSEMQSKLTPDIEQGFTAQGLNVFQGITLASIVEQEVNKPSDKPIVAQVFESRLKLGMPLGSDVTAYYGAIIAGQQPSVNYDSPYNTRLHTGLPVGPISNVTTTDLDAVAHPANTNYLYFVTGDDGTTYFAQTLEEHNQQVQQYCQKLCQAP